MCCEIVHCGSLSFIFEAERGRLLPDRSRCTVFTQMIFSQEKPGGFLLSRSSLRHLSSTPETRLARPSDRPALAHYGVIPGVSRPAGNRASESGNCLYGPVSGTISLAVACMARDIQ